MKAAVTSEVGAPFVVEDVEIDDPLDFEVLVDVEASGLCHSDVVVQQGGVKLPMPIVLGHEAAGTVKAIGAQVSDLAVGDRVVATLLAGCGHCDRCYLGRPYECPDQAAAERPPGNRPRLSWRGHPLTQFWRVSGFAEQILVHRSQLVKISKEVPADRACLLGCGVITGMGAVVNTARVQFGESVAVFGTGGVGLNAVQGAALAGAHRIIAVDPRPDMRKMARKFGATHTIDPAEADPVASIRDLTAGAGVQHAFEVAGLPLTARQALQCLSKGGTAYYLGMQPAGHELPVDIGADLLRSQAGMRGVYMGSTKPHHDIALYADLYLQGRLNLDDLVSSRITLNDINQGYATAHEKGAVRTVITFD